MRAWFHGFIVVLFIAWAGLLFFLFLTSLPGCFTYHNCTFNQRAALFDLPPAPPTPTPEASK